MKRQLSIHRMPVVIAEDANDLGRLAADRFAEALSAILAEKEEAAVIIATGNSQLPFVHALAGHPEIEWNRVRVFHMDEYLGMPKDHSASFRKWLQDNVVATYHPKEFFGIDGDAEPIEDELKRYADLLDKHDPDITVMGIGENGHLAFNDPPALFDTEKSLHIVELDEACRLQQVGEGHFPSLGETPTRAVSLTIPMLLRPAIVLVLVPDERKARAVRCALEGPVTPDCPASYLQRVSNAELFLDVNSASLLTH